MFPQQITVSCLMWFVFAYQHLNPSSSLVSLAERHSTIPQERKNGPLGHRPLTWLCQSDALNTDFNLEVVTQRTSKPEVDAMTAVHPISKGSSNRDVSSGGTARHDMQGSAIKSSVHWLWARILPVAVVATNHIQSLIFQARSLSSQYFCLLFNVLSENFFSL